MFCPLITPRAYCGKQLATCTPIRRSAQILFSPLSRRFARCS